MTTEHPSLVTARALRRKLAEGVPAFGPWLNFANPHVVEMLARRDFDFLMVDGEHSPIGQAELAGLLPAAELHRMAMLYRAPSRDGAVLKQALDAGASGLMVPMVESAEQARAIVAATRYAPLGRRGLGPWRASAFYEDGDRYFAEANAATTLILQIESSAGLRNLDEIAAVEGVDVLYVGPADMASSLGLPQGDWGPEMLAVFETVARTAKAHGKRAGMDLAQPARRAEMIALGFDVFTYGSDYAFLGEAAEASAREMRQALTSA